VSNKKRVVLDANILVRAVLGKKVGDLMETYEGAVSLCTPDHCVEEARRTLAAIALRREVDAALVAPTLELLIERFIDVVDRSFYGEFEERARMLIASRDSDDWPTVATALLLNAPIWTEDKDFFGSGIATWTTDRIEIYLRDG
jgi:predicted nucleic acid-binding protein